MEKESELKKINVLYVDDEAGNLGAFKATYRRDFNIYIAQSAAEGRTILDEHDIEIILTDQRMPEISGVEFLASIIPVYPDPIRILVTGYSDITAVVEAVNKGQIYKYVSKPWDTDCLRGTINEAYEVYSLRKENNRLTTELLKVNAQLEFMLRQKLSAE